MVRKKKKVVKRNFWFRERVGQRGSWSFIPANWKGWVALILLVGLNVFSANYFDVMNVGFDEVSKFLVVFLLSLVVFVLIARRKTGGVRNDK